MKNNRYKALIDGLEHHNRERREKLQGNGISKLVIILVFGLISAGLDFFNVQAHPMIIILVLIGVLVLAGILYAIWVECKDKIIKRSVKQKEKPQEYKDPWETNEQYKDPWES
ncbi:hypothetical protein V6615_12340 [Oscillospiraceae bacterium PP1C4]